MRLVFKFGILLGIFFGIWFGLNQINWMNIFQVKAMTQKTEATLGNLLWARILLETPESKDSTFMELIDSITHKLCIANTIDQQKVITHLVQSDEVNAYALPGGHMVVNEGLIYDVHSPEELAAVIAHELAHLELEHTMKKLVKELGLTVLVAMASGNQGSETVNRTIQTLSSSAFDRNMEEEADIKAVQYLTNAGIDPEHLANFLYRLSSPEEESNLASMISTHPNSKIRAKYILEESKFEKKDSKPVISEELWRSAGLEIKK